MLETSIINDVGDGVVLHHVLVPLHQVHGVVPANTRWTRNVNSRTVLSDGHKHCLAKVGTWHHLGLVEGSRNVSEGQIEEMFCQVLVILVGKCQLLNCHS